jgi:hypothetical protein
MGVSMLEEAVLGEVVARHEVDLGGVMSASSGEGTAQVEVAVLQAQLFATCRARR